MLDRLGTATEGKKKKPGAKPPSQYKPPPLFNDNRSRYTTARFGSQLWVLIFYIKVCGVTSCAVGLTNQLLATN